MVPSPDNHDRQAAILTGTQREYLAGESNIEPDSSHERTMRTRIRRRVRSALYDFPLLLELEKADRDRIFAPKWDNDVVEDPIRIHPIPDALAFLYLGVVDAPPGSIHPSPQYFGEVMAAAIQRALPLQGQTASLDDIDVEISIDGRPIEEVRESRLKELPTTQLEQLLHAGEITAEDFAEIVYERQDQHRAVDDK